MKNFPNSYEIIAAIIVICEGLTGFVPGGQYVTGKDGVVVYDGFSRQSMAMAFQFGGGFTNIITPTSGVLTASLGMACISYDKWLRKAKKPVLLFIAGGIILLLPTVLVPLAGF